jgi:3-hydroxybutyryl-CoA dehydratase
MSDIRKRAIQGLKIGDRFSVERTFTEKDMLKFSEITRDYNPVHFDRRFSAEKDFKGRICHGLLVASMLTEIGGQIGWLASVMNFRFKQPVYFGDTIKCSLSIIEIDEQNKRARAEAVFRNQEKAVVLEAELAGIIPNTRERQILNAMVAEGDPSNKIAYLD